MSRGVSRTFSRTTDQPFGKIEFRYTCNASKCPEANSYMKIGPGLRVTLADKLDPVLVGTANPIAKPQRAWSLYEIASDAASSKSAIGACLQNPVISTCPKFTDGPRLIQINGQKYAAIRGSANGAPIWDKSAATDLGSGIAKFIEYVNLKPVATNFQANCPLLSISLYSGSFPYRLMPCESSVIVSPTSNNTTPGQDNWREGANTIAIAATDYCNSKDCTPNAAAIGATVIVDNTAPRIGEPVCLAVKGDNGWLRGPANPVCSITASDDNPVAKPQPIFVSGLLAYSWYLDRGTICTQSDKPCSSSNLNFTVTEQGTTTIRSKALDRVGNLSSSYKVNKINYDSVAPGINNSRWFDNGAILSGTIPLNQTVNDDISKLSEARIEIRQNDDPWTTLNRRTWPSPTRAENYTAYFNTARFAPGYGYEIRIAVRDRAGNETVSSATSFEIVPGPPTPTALQVRANKYTVNKGGRVRFSYRTTNGTTDTIRVFINGRRVTRLSALPRNKTWIWRARKSGQTKVVFRPDNGPARTIRIRVRR